MLFLNLLDLLLLGCLVTCLFDCIVVWCDSGGLHLYLLCAYFEFGVWTMWLFVGSCVPLGGLAFVMLVRVYVVLVWFW